MIHVSIGAAIAAGITLNSTGLASISYSNVTQQSTLDAGVTHRQSSATQDGSNDSILTETSAVGVSWATDQTSDATLTVDANTIDVSVSLDSTFESNFSSSQFGATMAGSGSMSLIYPGSPWEYQAVAAEVFSATFSSANNIEFNIDILTNSATGDNTFPGSAIFTLRDPSTGQIVEFTDGTAAVFSTTSLPGGDFSGSGLTLPAGSYEIYAFWSGGLAGSGGGPRTVTRSWDGSISFSAQEVPVPATGALLFTAAIGVGFRRRHAA